MKTQNLPYGTQSKQDAWGDDQSTRFVPDERMSESCCSDSPTDGDVDDQWETVSLPERLTAAKKESTVDALATPHGVVQADVGIQSLPPKPFWSRWILHKYRTSALLLFFCALMLTSLLVHVATLSLLRQQARGKPELPPQPAARLTELEAVLREHEQELATAMERIVTLEHLLHEQNEKTQHSVEEKPSFASSSLETIQWLHHLLNNSTASAASFVKGVAEAAPAQTANALAAATSTAAQTASKLVSTMQGGAFSVLDQVTNATSTVTTQAAAAAASLRSALISSTGHVANFTSAAAVQNASSMISSFAGRIAQTTSEAANRVAAKLSSTSMTSSQTAAAAAEQVRNRAADLISSLTERFSPAAANAAQALSGGWSQASASVSSAVTKVSNATAGMGKALPVAASLQNARSLLATAATSALRTLNATSTAASATKMLQSTTTRAGIHMAKASEQLQRLFISLTRQSAADTANKVAEASSVSSQTDDTTEDNSGVLEPESAGVTEELQEGEGELPAAATDAVPPAKRSWWQKLTGAVPT